MADTLTLEIVTLCDPDANTARFIARIPDYVAHGVRAFTVCLQGGMPGYEGAVNSAFQPDGSLKGKTLFCEPGSDGMTIDNCGNIYLTGKGVSVFDSTGKKMEQIDVPEPWTANVCFGGKDRKTLFITASKGFYGIHMTVKGVDSQ